MDESDEERSWRVSQRRLVAAARSMSCGTPTSSGGESSAPLFAPAGPAAAALQADLITRQRTASSTLRGSPTGSARDLNVAEPTRTSTAELCIGYASATSTLPSTWTSTLAPLLPPVSPPHVDVTDDVSRLFESVPVAHVSSTLPSRRSSRVAPVAQYVSHLRTAANVVPTDFNELEPPAYLVDVSARQPYLNRLKRATVTPLPFAPNASMTPTLFAGVVAVSGRHSDRFTLKPLHVGATVTGCGLDMVQVATVAANVSETVAPLLVAQFKSATGVFHITLAATDALAELHAGRGAVSQVYGPSTVEVGYNLKSHPTLTATVGGLTASTVARIVGRNDSSATGGEKQSATRCSRRVSEEDHVDTPRPAERAVTATVRAVKRSRGRRGELVGRTGLTILRTLVSLMVNVRRARRATGDETSDRFSSPSELHHVDSMMALRVATVAGGGCTLTASLPGRIVEEATVAPDFICEATGVTPRWRAESVADGRSPPVLCVNVQLPGRAASVLQLYAVAPTCFVLLALPPLSLLQAMAVALAWFDATGKAP